VLASWWPKINAQ